MVMKYIPMKRNHKRPRILIAGLGNFLLKDDGVGVHVVREIQKKFSLSILAVEVGTAVLGAIHLFEWGDKILAIDAMQAGGPPGTLYSFTISDVKEWGPQASLRELRLLEVLRFLNRPFPEILVLGVEPETIDYGLELSAPVKRALPQLVQLVKETVAQWRRDSKVHPNNGM